MVRWPVDSAAASEADAAAFAGAADGSAAAARREAGSRARAVALAEVALDAAPLLSVARLDRDRGSDRSLRDQASRRDPRRGRGRARSRRIVAIALGSRARPRSVH